MALKDIIKNPTALTPAAQQLLGARLLFARQGDTDKKVISLGYVEQPQLTRSQNEKETYAAPFGASQLVNSFLTRIGRTMAFVSTSGTDPDIRALFEGGEAVRDTAAQSTLVVTPRNDRQTPGLLVCIFDDANAGHGEMWVAPFTKIQGNGFARGFDGENELALNFQIKFFDASSYTLPATVGSFATLGKARDTYVISGVPNGAADGLAEKVFDDYLGITAGA